MQEEGVMKQFLYRLGDFFHIIDDNNQLDLTDISFMLVIGKIMYSPGIDWAAVCALVPVILQQMHQKQIDSKNNKNSSN